MKALISILSLLVVLMACSPSPSGLGVDQASMDKSIRPQDDFFRHVNGTWLNTTEIPADKSRYGAFNELADQAEIYVRDLIKEAAQKQAATGSNARKVGDYYNSYMDTDTIESLGITPLRSELAKIDGIANSKQLAEYIGASQRINSIPFHLFVEQDKKNSQRYTVYFYQGGLGLPDRDYYLKEDARFVEYRQQYRRYIQTLLALAGDDDSEQIAEQIIQLETQLATAHWSRVKNRDPQATYNPYKTDNAKALMPTFNWQAFWQAAGVQHPDFVVYQPDYLQALDELLQTIPLSEWKNYFRFHLINDFASSLPQAYVDAHFDFYSKTLRGVKENRPRWKRAVASTNGVLGEAVGELYVAKHFKPEAKERVKAMVEHLRTAFAQSIETLDWMSDGTKQQAQKKLASFTYKIGYPDQWKDYRELHIEPKALIANKMRSAAFEYARDVQKLGKPVDRNEWHMTPQTVNAYYNPEMNEIVFPAAILQPPFFNVAADDAVNYGGIGGVIGHEFSHGFDDSGRQYDGDGNLKDWWTAEDASKFKARADKLVAQYDRYQPLTDQAVNGRLTLGENIGDLAGLTMAFRAWQLSLNSKKATVIDGYTGEQRVFLGWAQVWRMKMRDEALRQRLLTDPHSPAEYRVKGPLSNIDAFYTAFDIKEGDAMYLPPEQRVYIW